MADKLEELEIANREHLGENINAKRGAMYGFDPIPTVDYPNGQWRRIAVDANGLVGFSPTTTTISEDGNTITETDGTRTRTTTISGNTITEEWS